MCSDRGFYGKLALLIALEVKRQNTKLLNFFPQSEYRERSTNLSHQKPLTNQYTHVEFSTRCETADVTKVANDL